LLPTIHLRKPQVSVYSVNEKIKKFKGKKMVDAPGNILEQIFCSIVTTIVIGGLGGSKNLYLL
jgi:hypothetical protein